MCRFIIKWVNGVWVIFDRWEFKNCETFRLRTRALKEFDRRRLYLQTMEA